jgi:hypothetical protein
MLNRSTGAGGSSAPRNAPVAERDADCHEAKYLKRRSARTSPSRVAGLLLLFATVLALWHRSVGTSRRREADRARQARLRGERLLAAQGRKLEELFLSERKSPDNRFQRERLLAQWLDQLDKEIRNNVRGGIRWVRPYLLPPLDGSEESQVDDAIASDETAAKNGRAGLGRRDHPSRQRFFNANRGGTVMAWETEWERMLVSGEPIRGPLVDYTDRGKYAYPEVQPEVPPASEYPPLRPLGELMSEWNHDEDNGGVIRETLQHFNYSDPRQLAMAIKYREAEIPFKMYDVPEISAATAKWTDEYVAAGFRSPAASGHAQESPNNYFAFFIPKTWLVNSLGPVPVRGNDWDYAKWASHARYADAVSLPPDAPHFYWQSGVSKEQHYQDESMWAFISRDLPSFSARADNFFLFHAQEQKGIQCRMGERGVVAATHYDSGMNMVAMIRGAKRYILQPPRECSKLGLFKTPRSPLYRHSVLNFAHMKHLDDAAADMSDDERAWLHKASGAQSVETVLKEGEVLYIPR